MDFALLFVANYGNARGKKYSDPTDLGHAVDMLRDVLGQVRLDARRHACTHACRTVLMHMNIVATAAATMQSCEERFLSAMRDRHMVIYWHDLHGHSDLTGWAPHVHCMVSCAVCTCVFFLQDVVIVGCACAGLMGVGADSLPLEVDPLANMSRGRAAAAARKKAGLPALPTKGVSVLLGKLPAGCVARGFVQEVRQRQR